MRGNEAVDALKREIRQVARPEKADFLSNWFKNRPGYPPDDHFLGVSVPNQRKLARAYYRKLSINDMVGLLRSKWHEERMTALLLLMLRYQKFPFNRSDIFQAYIDNLTYINNWDLVDTSAPHIVGVHLQGSDYKQQVLQKMAASDGVWERRVAMLAAGYSLRSGDADDTILIAKQLLHDEDDYIHKAVGWMLREMGKRVSQDKLKSFLDKYATTMPRTSLRYAIERLPKQERTRYMAKGRHAS